MRQMAQSNGIRAGDPREVAIPHLLEQYGDRLYSLGVRLCRNATDAEDLVQEVFLQAWKKWKQFEGRSSPMTWLYTIAARACQRMHRRRAGQPERIESLNTLLPFDEAKLCVVGFGRSGPASSGKLDEARERVEQAIASLPLMFRLPLVLKDVIGLTIPEVATALGVKPGTVKTRVHRARLRVRKALIAVLPKRDGPPPAYSRQVCLDLLRAKQDALDRGDPFPVRDEILCERCRAVFESMDFAKDACEQIAAGRIPARLRRELQSRLTA